MSRKQVGAPHVFALIDCNNFFVSCQRIFRPDLKDRPVVVLSSGDGIVVARSNEAKALGIPMGAPAFKYRQLFDEHRVVKFSGNFELYGDISRRITDLLTTITPRIEVYSVDESFLDLTDLDIEDYGEWGREVRKLILKWIGVPVSIGIAPSKTLAKLASERAKKNPDLEGALSLVNISEEKLKQNLQAVPLEDLWGVGRRLAPRLRASGLSTSLDVAALNPKLARKLFGTVHGEQMVMELNGISCFGLQKEHKLQKSIARTRTFGEDINDLHVIEAAIANFCARATYHLRREGQLAYRAAFFVTTNRNHPNYRRLSGEVKFAIPSSDPGQICAKLVHKLAGVFDRRLKYHRAGVMLYDLVPSSAVQTKLGYNRDMAKLDKSQLRLLAVDKINTRFGPSTVHIAAEDLGKQWQPKATLRSPSYTTSWKELPVAKII